MVNRFQIPFHFLNIANVMFMYTNRPKTAEFQEVAKQIVHKYPFLVSTLDTEGHVRLDFFVFHAYYYCELGTHSYSITRSF